MGDDDDSNARTVYAPPPPPASSSSLLVDAPRDGSTAQGVIVAGRYEVLALLGVGGMGAVYRARDLELDEVVALKMLRHELLSMPGILDRFRQEVRLARKVTSPHVARTFDIGEHDGDKFLTMELVEGESLADEMQRAGPLSLTRVAALAADVCDGLAAAHAASVVHRDLKPENVLLGRDGSIKITDFGIATAQVDVRLTQGSSGTPAYMAPEQVTGDAKIDARADVYAFGIMLYEMLTGELPWKGSTSYAIASARLLADPPDVRLLRPDTPPTLADLVRSCMAKDRDGRPHDARALAATLARVAEAPALAPGFIVAPAVPAAPVTSPGLLPPSQHLKMVAVLPLGNRGAAEDEYLADGLTDDVIDSLSMVRGLRVRSRGAVMRFKGQERDPRDIGRDLGVHVFVDGSVRRDGPQLRVAVRLVSVEDDFQLWAKRFERPASEVLAIGDEVARAIAAALAVESGERRAATRDPAVVDLYLRARHAYFTFGVADTERAVKLFEEARRLAPDDPLVLAGAAMAYLAFFSIHPDVSARFQDVVVMAERAVSLAPELADGHLALANLRVHEGRSVEAVREARLAIAAAPSSAEAHFLLGRFFAESGDVRGAIAHLDLAQALDPRMNLALAERARVHALSGEWSRAASLLAQVEATDSPFLHWGTTLRFTMWRNDPANNVAVVAAARASGAADHPTVSGGIALLEGRDTSEYEAGLDHFLAIANTLRRRAFFCQLKAESSGFRGEHEACLAALAAADERGLTDLLWIDHCPALNVVRNDPRFAVVRAHVAGRAGVILDAIREGW